MWLLDWLTKPYSGISEASVCFEFSRPRKVMRPLAYIYTYLFVMVGFNTGLWWTMGKISARSSNAGSRSVWKLTLIPSATRYVWTKYKLKFSQLNNTNIFIILFQFGFGYTFQRDFATVLKPSVPPFLTLRPSNQHQCWMRLYNIGVYNKNIETIKHRTSNMDLPFTM